MEQMAETSSNSDSEEFFDAEDITPHRSSRRSRSSLNKNQPAGAISPKAENSAAKQETTIEETPAQLENNAALPALPLTQPDVPDGLVHKIRTKKENLTLPVVSAVLDEKEEEVRSRLEETQTRRRRVQELRQRLTTDDDPQASAATSGSPQGSTASSVDNMYLTGRASVQSAPSTSHPFRIIDTTDSVSLSSIGRGGLLLSQFKSEPASVVLLTGSSSQPLQEPDVIASTKGLVPVAPPRRKKKPKAPSVLPQASGEEASPLPSPASTLATLAEEWERSLDLKAAVKGQYVVKPQDTATSRAEPSPPPSSPTSPLAAAAAASAPLPPHSSSCSSGFSSACSSLPRSARPSPRNSKERNGAAGIKAEELGVRTRTDSGKQLTDLEILEQVTVLNLDTGERVPLSIAEDKLPQCINPLSLHIMRLTSEYVSNSSLEKDRESDEESVMSERPQTLADDTESINIPVKKRSQIRRLIGQSVRKTIDKAKHLAHEVRLHGSAGNSGREALKEAGEEEETAAKIKLRAGHKGPYEFDCVKQLQDMSNAHSGPIWCVRFSVCGRLLATAGQDRVLRVWVLREAMAYFSDMCTKYSHPKSSPTPSQESLQAVAPEEPKPSADDGMGPFMARPFVSYVGHTSDLLDVSWSKNYFVLSSSMDKTVRLWHISRQECLCCFQHIDFVTAIVFHPRDDRYFLSGSLDGKLRLWNIPDKKVAVWTEVEGPIKLVTAANFCQNGKFAVIGTYDGRCVFYTTENLKYHTQIHVRSSRGRNSQGRKITGIEPMPGEDKILVSSNDSRIRLYDLRDLNLSCKYKGYVNISSQISASFSHDGKYITSGSENQVIYIWRTYHEQAKFTSARRDRNSFWEGIKAHNAMVTCSVFAPHPASIIRQLEATASLNLLGSGTAGTLQASTTPEAASSGDGYILVSADFNGCLKVFLNRPKAKHSSLPASAMA
ncbi:WD repeat-containing protein 44 isoform X3 [Neocloeon triangulifer]|uniref:WD repeat-containing protein 44 isoform X3 n=1 Tax=Neocloeon triangulifer TaxID=2078957 RepID=UPI00286F706C|nr:WD repeat-containing protein 44 isoform X3 [Neocloeon triangulifer]